MAKKQYYQEYVDKNPNSPTYGETIWKHLPEKDYLCNCEPNWQEVVGEYLCDESTKIKYAKEVDLNNCEDSPAFRRGRVIETNSEDCGATCEPAWVVSEDNPTVCDGKNKYERLVDANNCANSPSYKKGKLIESNSEDCGFDECEGITEEDWVPVSGAFKCNGKTREQKYENKNYPCPANSEQYKWVEVDDPNGECNCEGESTEEVWVKDTSKPSYCNGETGYSWEKQTNPCVLDSSKRPGFANSTRSVVDSTVDCECHFVEDGNKRCENNDSYQYWKNTNPLRKDCSKSKTLVKSNDPDCETDPCANYSSNWVDTGNQRCNGTTGQKEQRDEGLPIECRLPNRWITDSSVSCEPTWEKDGNPYCDGTTAKQKFKNTNSLSFKSNGGNYDMTKVEDDTSGLDCSCNGKSKTPNWEFTDEIKVCYNDIPSGAKIEHSRESGRHPELYNYSKQIDENTCSLTHGESRYVPNSIVGDGELRDVIPAQYRCNGTTYQKLQEQVNKCHKNYGKTQWTDISNDTTSCKETWIDTGNTGCSTDDTNYKDDVEIWEDTGKTGCSKNMNTYQP